MSSSRRLPRIGAVLREEERGAVRLAMFAAMAALLVAALGQPA
jgi:hypothetical protein